MSENNKSLYGIILRNFTVRNKDLINKMKNCNHSEGDHLNPFHLEDDIWTHTMMVFANSNNLYKPVETYKNVIDKTIKALCCLFHDIGKIDTRVYDEVKNRVRFISHANASVKYVYELVPPILETVYDEYEYIFDESNYDKKMFIEYCIYNIAFVVSRHDNYYDSIKDDDYRNLDKDHVKFKISNFCNLDEKLIDYMTHLIYCDCNGQISDSNKSIFGDSSSIFIPIKSKLKIEMEKYKYKIILLSGIPGSGKDYYVENVLKKEFKDENIFVLSWDEIYVKKFKEHNDTSDIHPNEIYKKAFDWCVDENINMDKESMILINEKLETKEPYTFIINRTNLPIKSRKRMLNYFQKIDNVDTYKKAITIACPISKCVQRCKDRESQPIPEYVINGMCKTISLPSLNEGFHDVEFIWND